MLSLVYVIFLFGLMLAFIILPEYIDNIIYEQKNPETTNNVIHHLQYKIPDGFKIDYNSTESRTFQYKDETSGDYCKIAMHVNKYVDSYSSHEDFLKYSISITNYQEITTETIKGNPWRKIIYTNNNNTFYFYGYLHRNKGYLVNYNIISDTTGTCTNKYYEFINSLRLI